MTCTNSGTTQQHVPTRYYVVHTHKQMCMTRTVGSSFRKHSNQGLFTVLGFCASTKIRRVEDQRQRPIKDPVLVLLGIIFISSPLSFVIGCLLLTGAFHELQSTPLHKSIAVDSIARLREASKVRALLMGRIDGLRCVALRSF